MNIYLVPYNWTRHVAVALTSGGAALATWWIFLHLRVWLGPTLFEYGILWSREAEGPLFLAVLAGTIAGAGLLTEHSLRRSGIVVRLATTGIAAGAAFVLTMLSYAVLQLMVGLLASEEMKEIARDPSTTAHRYHVWMWFAAGVCTGIGAVIPRRGKGFFAHIAGGFVAGGAAAALFQYLGYHLIQDFYLASAFAALLWGVTFGALAWGVPDELYAGWVRVLSPYRYGYRVPIDKPDGAASERFIGHFPRGLDLFLPVEQGVAELHTSFVKNSQGNYTVRGLSQAPTLVKRPLERVDIRYDPVRPAPLETTLQSEDRVIMSDGTHETEVEFLLLPREES